MRPTLLPCALMVACLAGYWPTLHASDAAAGPTMSSLNGQSTPTAPAGDSPASSDPAPTAGGPIVHAVVPPTSAPVSAEKKGKNGNKSRIARTIKVLDAAIDELTKAPDDLGGHKAEAITACQAARDQLKLVVAYREEHPVPGTVPAPAPAP